MKQHAAPIIAATLLLLPVLYLGSYFALLKPYDHPVWANTMSIDYEHYRWGGSFSAKLYWPLEQIDRQVRPDAWELVEPGWTSYPIPLDSGPLPEE